MRRRRHRRRTLPPGPQAHAGPTEAGTHLVHPVLAVMVLHALVQCPGRQHQHEVAGAHDALDELVLKLARFQFLHIDEDTEAVQLQVHLQEAARRSVSLPWPRPKARGCPPARSSSPGQLGA